jgi:hypothetical protein
MKTDSFQMLCNGVSSSRRFGLGKYPLKAMLKDIRSVKVRKLEAGGYFGEGTLFNTGGFLLVCLFS